MFRSMMVGQAPRNVNEAELAGWGGLETDCGTCRTLTIIPWARIRKRSGHRKLSDIVERLRCASCGTRPRAVSLHRVVPQERGSPQTERERL
jgi:hypothetical protein